MRQIEAACLCRTGRVRTNNEDNFYFSGEMLPVQNCGTPDILTHWDALKQPICLAVFDGMGGEACGEQAAYLAADTLREQLQKPVSDPSSWMADVCQAANRRICKAASGLGGVRMGSTAAMLYVGGESVWACNIGDSRIYRLRSGELRQLSVDHTEAALMRSQGIGDRKPLLTQHLGIWPQEMLIEPHIARHDVLPGDWYLICSDGLTDMLADTEITLAMNRQTTAEAAVQVLVSQALSSGGRDNVTVIACRVC